MPRVDQALATRINIFIDQRAVANDDIGKVTNHHQNKDAKKNGVDESHHDKQRCQAECSGIPVGINPVSLNRNASNSDDPHGEPHNSPRQSNLKATSVKNQDQKIRQATDHQKNQHWRNCNRSVVSSSLSGSQMLPTL